TSETDDADAAGKFLAVVEDDQKRAGDATAATENKIANAAKLELDLQSRIATVNSLLDRVSRAADLQERLAQVEALGHRVDSLEQKIQKLERIPPKQEPISPKLAQLTFA